MSSDYWRTCTAYDKSRSTSATSGTTRTTKEDVQQNADKVYLVNREANDVDNSEFKIAVVAITLVGAVSLVFLTVCLICIFGVKSDGTCALNIRRTRRHQGESSLATAIRKCFACSNNNFCFVLFHLERFWSPNSL